MQGDADVAAVASLIGEPARATVLTALVDGRPLTASALAGEAGIAPSTLSAHLARLVEGGLVTVERSGRNRYYRLASPEVAEVLETLARIAPTRRVRSLNQATHGEAIRRARSCYDHLAGRLGVALWDAMQAEVLVELTDPRKAMSGLDAARRTAPDAYRLTPRGRQKLTALGVDIEPVGRRPLIRTCIDWSEQRPHLSGALGASIFEVFLRRGWLRRGQRRVVRLTEAGGTSLLSEFGVTPGC